MKTITLQRLTLEHFKGAGAVTLEFGGRDRSIYGRNGTGKTTIMDAWFWLLTGKDGRGDQDFEVKPLDGDNRVIDHAARSAVEAELLADGESVTLRREFYEKWSKKRGSAEACFDGHSTDFFVDGVPKSKAAYEEAVAEMIPLDKLRLLSGVTAFAALPWRERRDILFEMAGLGSDRELMERGGEFAPLLEAMGRASLEEYQKALKARRKKINSRLNDLPGLIAENQRAADGLGECPFDALRASLSDLEEEEHRLTAGIARDSAAATGALQNTLDGLRLDLDTLELDNRAHRQEQEAAAPDRRGMEREISRLEDGLDRLTREFRRQSDSYHQYKKTAKCHEDNAEEYRRMWAEENAAVYAGDTLCPTCGQPLPAPRQAQARKAWERAKTDKLAQIQGLGAGAVENAKRMAALADQAREDMIRNENAIAQAKDELAAARKALAAIAPPEITDLPGYEQRKADIMARMDAAREQLNAAQTSERTRTDELRRRRQAIREEMGAIRTQLAREDALAQLRGRIGELEAERRELAGALAEVDRLTDLAEEFIRFKARYTTMQVNGLFRLASFRLFTEQVNGGIADACDILCHGVPYDGGLNNGARINVGLDIIATLGRWYGYSVPVFVDNAESVTDLEPAGAQVIRLVVSEADEKVRIEG